MQENMTERIDLHSFPTLSFFSVIFSPAFFCIIKNIIEIYLSKYLCKVAI